MVREREQLSSSSNTIVINFVLPAGEAMSQPPLSALLGQVQINSSEFCKLFNTQSLIKYNSGVLLNVLVFKHPDNKFTITIKGLFLPFIFFQASNLVRRKIYLETLYDSFKLYCLDKQITMNTSAARSFFGTLRCSGFKIRLLQTRKKSVCHYIFLTI